MFLEDVCQEVKDKRKDILEGPQNIRSIELRLLWCKIDCLCKNLTDATVGVLKGRLKN